jgi:hypothetical protein
VHACMAEKYMVYQKQISTDTSSMQLLVVEHNIMAGKEGLRHVVVICRQSKEWRCCWSRRQTPCPTQHVI